MLYKKIVLIVSILAIFGFVFAFNVPNTKALTQTELQALILNLQLQIAQLQQQLTQMQSEASTTVAWCHTFNINLKIGDTGSEVAALETALRKEGFTIGMGGINEFDEEMASAVVAFQEKYRAEVLTPVRLTHGNGYVGRLTRAQLNKLYGCGVTPVCIQVITFAKNAITGECKSFPTPCDVPAGWNKVTSCTTPCKNECILGSKTCYGAGYKTCTASADGCNYWSVVTTVCPSGQTCSNGICFPTKPSCSQSCKDEGYSFGTCKSFAVSPGGIAEEESYLRYYDKLGITTDCTLPSEMIGSNSNCFCYPKKGGFITVTSPNGGEQLDIDGTYEIKWKNNITTSDSNIKIVLYSKERLADIAQIDFTEDDGSYMWNIADQRVGVMGSPRISAGDYKIHLCKDNFCDMSDNYFNITPAKSLTVTSPNGGETLIAGKTHDITWTIKDYDQIGIYLTDIVYRDGMVPQLQPSCEQCAFGTYCKPCLTPIVTNLYAGTGKYTWTVPGNIAKAKIFIEVIGVMPKVNDMSDNYFNITPAKSLTVTSPNGGEQWMKGYSYPITWKSTGVSKVNIYTKNMDNVNPLVGCSCQIGAYCPPCGYTKIASDILASTGAYYWSIPSSYITGNYSILIDEAGILNGILDKGDETFSINSNTDKSLTVTSPNGGEQWMKGYSYPITWKSTGVSKVNIYTKNMDNVNPLVGCSCQIGAYCPPCGYTKIASDILSSSGKYYWSIPNTYINGNYSLFIDDGIINGISDKSDGTFNITGSGVNPNLFVYLSMSVDSTMAKFMIGNNGNTTAYNFATKVYLAEIGASRTMEEIPSLSLSYTEQCSFSVVSSQGDSLMPGVQKTYTCQYISPLRSGAYYVVKMVTDVNNSVEELNETDNVKYATFSTSNSTKLLNVTSPNGGESFQIGQTYDITWEQSGVDTISIELDRGTTAWYLAYNVSATAGKYSWTVPSSFAPASDYKIKLIGQGTAAGIEDSSSGYFSITAASTCSDSDNGRDYYNRGTITETINGTTYTYTDFCYAGASTVSEYYCPASRETFGVSEDFICPNGCSNGACIAQQEKYLLNITKYGVGIVTSTMPNTTGINCGVDCNELYPSGTSITLKATPATGYMFAGWSGPCGGIDDCVFSIERPTTVTASFMLIPTVKQLTVLKTGSGTVTGLRIDCGTDCRDGYVTGSPVSLTATPATGYTFSGWEGDCSGTSTCDLTMDTDKSVTAHFATAVNYTLNVAKEGTGTGTILATDIHCGSDCDASFQNVTTVSITASPDPGSIFVEWGGDCVGTIGNVCSLTVDGIKIATAIFGIQESPPVIGTKVNLPECSSGLNVGCGVWVKHSSGTWAADKVCKMNTTCDKSSYTAIGTTFLNKLATNRSSWTSNAAAYFTWNLLPVVPAAAYTNLCVKCSTDATAVNLMSCPFTGTSGDVYVKLNSDSSWDQKCQLNTTCSKRGGWVQTKSGVYGAKCYDATSGYLVESGCTYCVVASATSTNPVPTTKPTLTVTKTGSGTMGATGLTCTSTSCTGTYNTGDSVSISATPATGYTGPTWAGCDSVVSSKCNVVMTGDKNITVTFTPQTVTKYSLALNKSGSGTISGNGLVCTSSGCNGSYTSGTQVTLTAYPSTGYTVKSWSGCDSQSGSICTVYMTGPKYMVVTFESTSPTGVGNFNVSVDSPINITPPTSGTKTVYFNADAIRTSDVDKNVTWSYTGAPAGVTLSFTPSSCTMNCGVSGSIVVSSSVVKGTYTVTVKGTNTTGTKTATMILNIGTTNTSANLESTLSALYAALAELLANLQKMQQQ